MGSTLITWRASINSWLSLWLVAPWFVVGSSGLVRWNDVIVGAIISVFLATAGVLVASVLATVHPRCKDSVIRWISFQWRTQHRYSGP